MREDASDPATPTALDRKELARLLTAIGEPTRLEIVQLLVDHGPLKVGDIAAAFVLSRAAISHHLRVLRDAGVLETERKAQEIHHRVACEHVASRLRTIADALTSCERPAPVARHGPRTDGPSQEPR